MDLVKSSVENFSEDRSYGLSSIPVTLGDEVPVGIGEDFNFKEIAKIGWFRLVPGEGFIDFTIILEFAEHEFILSDWDGTACIAVVDMGKIFSSLHILLHIFDDDRSLSEDCCGCFGGRGIAGITEAPDIFVLDVLHGELVDICVAGLVSESAFLDEGGWDLWWDYVQGIELDFYEVVGTNLLEDCDFFCLFYFDKFMFMVEFNSFLVMEAI